MDEAGVPSDRQQGNKSSRGRGNYKPKGRVADPQARADIAAILGDEPPRLHDRPARPEVVTSIS